MEVTANNVWRTSTSSNVIGTRRWADSASPGDAGDVQLLQMGRQLAQLGVAAVSLDVEGGEARHQADGPQVLLRGTHHLQLLHRSRYLLQHQLAPRGAHVTVQPAHLQSLPGTSK